jgi:hypothetical protein
VNAASIIRQLEEAVISLRSEWWITDTGDLLNADEHGDYHHQDHVIDVICGIVRTYAGMEPVDGDDATTCRVEVADHLFEEHPEMDDPMEEVIIPQIVRDYGEGMAKDMLNQISGHGDSDGYDYDARAFAVKWWGWIRVAGWEAEMRDFSPEMLKRCGSGLADIVEQDYADEMDGYEEVEIMVSIYGKPGRTRTTIGALESGRIERDNTPDTDALRAAGKAAADKLDRDATPAFYKGRSGG